MVGVLAKTLSSLKAYIITARITKLYGVYVIFYTYVVACVLL